MQFQAVCSKSSKKLTLTLTATTLEEAREMLHRQGYSIIEIHPIEASTESGNFFYFDAVINGVTQTGKIQSTDIFKSYKKLIEDLKYDVRYIYTTESMPEDQKRIITAKVKDGYRLYKESIGEEVEERPKEKYSREEIDMRDVSPEIIKEIAKYNGIIDATIIKIQNIFLKYHDTITPEFKTRLEFLENNLIQNKWTRNLWRIKSVVEQALITIWEIEVSLLKLGMTEEKKKFLEETNALLKQVGSKDRIQTEQEKQQSFGYKLNSFLDVFTKKKPKEVEQINKKDTSSFSYFKNKRELDIYKKKLTSLEFSLIKAIVTFHFTEVKRLYLKRRLIRQNIQIIDNRINNRVISYTKIIHGVDYYFSLFFKFLSLITTILFYSVFFYTLAFILLHTLNGFWLIHATVAGKTIFIVTITVIITFFLSYIRGWYTLIFFTPILIATIYFLSSNF